MKPNLFAVWKKREAELGDRLTLKEVSRETGISVPTLSRWMNGKVQRFNTKTIAALTRYFGCTVDELLVEGEEVSS